MDESNKYTEEDILQATIWVDILVEPDSEAEEYLVNEILTKCKDPHYVSLGSIYGTPYNVYSISKADRENLNSLFGYLYGNN